MQDLQHVTRTVIPSIVRQIGIVSQIFQVNELNRIVNHIKNNRIFLFFF